MDNYWTVSQAVTWIATGDDELVRVVDTSGREFYERCERSALEAAGAALREKMTSGKLQATGKRRQEARSRANPFPAFGTREIMPSYAWIDMAIFPMGDLFPDWREVLLKASEVQKLFPATRAPRKSKPGMSVDELKAWLRGEEEKLGQPPIIRTWDNCPEIKEKVTKPFFEGVWKELYSGQKRGRREKIKMP